MKNLLMSMMNGIDEHFLSAAQFDNAAIFNNLLEREADINIQNRSGDTFLQLAFQKKEQPIVNCLLEYASNVNTRKFSSNESLLHFDICYEQVSIIDTLLKNEADLNHSIIIGQTLLETALYRRNWPIVNKLLDFRATD